MKDPYPYLFAGMRGAKSAKSYPGLCPHCKRITVYKFHRFSFSHYCSKAQTYYRLLKLRMH